MTNYREILRLSTSIAASDSRSLSILYSRCSSSLSVRANRKCEGNPPKGYSKAEIERMKDDDLLDMDYFLHELDGDDWD